MPLNIQNLAMSARQAERMAECDVYRVVGSLSNNIFQTVEFDRTLIEDTQLNEPALTQVTPISIDEAQLTYNFVRQELHVEVDAMTRVEAIEAMMRGEKVRYSGQDKRAYCFFDKERGFYINKNGNTYLMKDSWAKTDWEIYEELSLKDEYKKVMKKFA